MKKEIVFWRGGGEARLTLIRALQGEGFEVSQVIKLEEVLDAISKIKPPFWIVDASGGERELSKRIGELQSANTLYDLPVLFIGAGASTKTLSLLDLFPRFKALDVPFKIADVFSSIKEITSVDLPKRKPPQKLAPIESTTGTPSIGGKQLVSANSLDAFDDQQIVPPHPKREVLEKGLSRITEASEWLGIHARRTALTSSMISGKLAFGPERDTNVKTVSLLLNWGLLEEKPQLTREDLFLTTSDETKQLIAESYQQSANFLNERLQDEIAGRTMQAISKLITGEKQNENKDIVLDAQCAFITELTNRACFSYGYWNSRGAYRVMNNLRLGGKFPIDKHIAELMLRILSEAVSTSLTLNDMTIPSLTDKSRKAVFDAERREAQKEAERLFGLGEQQNISLAEMTAGMLLARPLTSRDGRVIIRANTELDKDMIVRIWKLAAVLPLEPKVIVARELPLKPAKVALTKKR